MTSSLLFGLIWAGSLPSPVQPPELDSIPILRAHLATGALQGDVLEIAGEEGGIPLWIPSTSLQRIPGPNDESVFLARHLAQPSGEGPVAPSLPVRSELVAWRSSEGEYAEAARLLVREGALLEQWGAGGGYEEWIYLLEVVSGELESLEPWSSPVRGGGWVSPSTAGPPSALRNYPPSAGEMATRWAELMEDARTRLDRAPTLQGGAVMNIQPPYSRESVGHIWLSFQGPQGAVKYVTSVQLPDALSDYAASHLLWVVDEAGRIIYERLTQGYASAAGVPIVTQDLNGNGIEEVLFASRVLYWTGEEWNLTSKGWPTDATSGVWPPQ